MKKRNFVIAIIVPFVVSYIITLLFGKGLESSVKDVFYSGRSIVIQEMGQSIDVEEYVVMAVSAQIPASWSEEVLKAQAILARTFIYGKMGQEQSISDSLLDLTVYSTSQMEAIWGRGRFEMYYNKVRNAVKETQGYILVFEGKPIEVLYHYASCGTTRADTTGFYPYFQAVPSTWDVNVEGYTQTITLTEEELLRKIRLLEGGEQIGEGTIQITKKDAIGYVEEVLIEGKSFTGAQVAQVLGVASTCFTIEFIEGSLRIHAKGIGHGYGMSQWGAKCMAEEGKKVDDILIYYYVGCAIQK